jgi:hypothetical protein
MPALPGAKGWYVPTTCVVVASFEGCQSVHNIGDSIRTANSRGQNRLTAEAPRR